MITEKNKHKWFFGAMILLLIYAVCIASVNAGNWTRYQRVSMPDADSFMVILTTGVDRSDSDMVTTMGDSVLHTMDSALAYDVEVFTFFNDNAYTWFDYSTPPLISNAEVSTIAYVDSVGKNLSEQGGIAGANRVLAFLALSTTDSSTITGVDISITDTAGNNKERATSHSGGTCSVSVVDGLYSIRAIESGYTFATDSFTVGADYTDTVWGVVVSIPAASSADNCTVYGDLMDPSGTAIQYATVTATLAENATDTCSSLSILRRVVSTKTNSSGRWTLDLIKSKCLDNQNYYDITIQYGGDSKSTSFSVPDSTTHKLIF